MAKTKIKPTTISAKSYISKPPGRLNNSDVLSFIEDYKEWMHADKENITLSDFCKVSGISNPYRFKDYLMRNFTGMNNTIDFQAAWSELEKIREDKLIKLGLFDKAVNTNFLTSLMKSRFGWHDNTVVVGISMSDIIEAKKQALSGKSK